MQRRAFIKSLAFGLASLPVLLMGRKTGFEPVNAGSTPALATNSYAIFDSDFGPVLIYPHDSKVSKFNVNRMAQDMFSRGDNLQAIVDANDGKYIARGQDGTRMDWRFPCA